jgi:hypothetical protein
MAAATSLTGKRVTIQTAGPESIQCTGTVQEVVQLNGNITILLREEDTFKLIDTKNIVTIQELDSEASVQAEAASRASSPNPPCQYEHEQQEPVEQELVEQEQEQEPAHQCAICLESIDMMQNAVSTGCGHQFHFTCLIQNMSTSSSSTRNQCPLCRNVIMQDHAVYRNDHAEREVFERILLSNEEVRNEVEIARRIRGDLHYQYYQTSILRDRINRMRRTVHQDAIALVDQAALRSNLYARITGLVNSAANNDIRENYHDMHEIFEEEIRNVCFDLALTAIETGAVQDAELALEVGNNPVPVQRNNRNEVIIVD